MRIVIGADHRGYELKDEIAAALTRDGHEVLDVGTNSAESVDYPDYARAVGGAIVEGRAEAGGEGRPRPGGGEGRGGGGGGGAGPRGGGGPLRVRPALTEGGGRPP